MKKLIKYFSVCALVAFTLICAFGKVGTIYRGVQTAVGLITENMMLLSAGNSTWNFSQDIHGFVNAPLASNAKLDRYLSGLNTWVTFDDLYRDPAGGPYGAVAKNSLLANNGAGRWYPLGGTVSSGYVLQIGDDPGVIGVGTNDLFWGPTPATAAGWTSLAGYFMTHNQNEILVTSATTGNQLKASGIISPSAGVLNLTSIGADAITVDQLNVNTITFPGGELAVPASGSYTPTLTPVAGCSGGGGAVAHPLRWIRVGSQVHISGLVEMFISGGVTVTFRVSLPPEATSDLTATDQLAGTAPVFTSIGVASALTVSRIVGDTLNNQAVISYTGGAASVNALPIDFTYTIQ